MFSNLFTAYVKDNFLLLGNFPAGSEDHFRLASGNQFWIGVRLHAVYLEPVGGTKRRLGEDSVCLFGQDHVVHLLELDRVRLHRWPRR